MANTIINGNGNTSWQLPSRGISIIGSMKVYDTYNDLLLDQQKGAFAWVDDASGDPTVGTGGALYRIKDDKLIKMLETEGMDQIFGSDVPWDKLLNKPESTVIEIDDAVAASHTHENKNLLDSIVKDGNNVKVGDDTVITDKNIGDHIGLEGNNTLHTHTNKEVLDKFSVTETGEVVFNDKKVITEENVSSLRIQNIVKNIGEVTDGEVSFDLNSGNYFIIEASDGYAVPKFAGDVTNVSGTIIVRGGTPILWPTGLDENGFYWIWGTVAQDISNNPRTDVIVLDYRIVDKYVFIDETCSKIGEI